MDEKIRDIKDIQNTLWLMYKDFLEDHNVRKYNERAQELVRKYMENRPMLLFCQNLVITWAPVINDFAEEFRNMVEE